MPCPLEIGPVLISRLGTEVEWSGKQSQPYNNWALLEAGVPYFYSALPSSTLFPRIVLAPLVGQVNDGARLFD